MDRIRLEKVVAERTHRVLGVSRRSVDVIRWDGDDTVEVTHISLSRPLGNVSMDRLRKYIFYLDHVIPGYASVSVGGARPEIVIPASS